VLESGVVHRGSSFVLDFPLLDCSYRIGVRCFYSSSKLFFILYSTKCLGCTFVSCHQYKVVHLSRRVLNTSLNPNNVTFSILSLLYLVLPNPLTDGNTLFFLHTSSLWTTAMLSRICKGTLRVNLPLVRVLALSHVSQHRFAVRELHSGNYTKVRL
jgi:hypothetical protein